MPETLRGQVLQVYPLTSRYFRFMVFSGLFYLNKICSQISNRAKFKTNMFNFSHPYLSHWGLLISSTHSNPQFLCSVPAKREIHSLDPCDDHSACSTARFPFCFCLVIAFSHLALQHVSNSQNYLFQLKFIKFNPQ